MRKACVLLAMLVEPCLWAGGPDDVALWRYDLPGLNQPTFTLVPSAVSKRSLNTTIIYSNPYGINSLHWSYFGLEKGFGTVGIAGSFRYYGLTDFFSEYKASLAGAATLGPYLAGALLFEYENQFFAGVGNYFRVDLGARASLDIDKFTGILALDGINLKAPYEFRGIREPLPHASVSYKPKNDMLFSVAFRRTDLHRNRWYFGQTLRIIDEVNLRAEYVTNPNCLSGGLDLLWKRTTLTFTYQAIGRLNDTVILGLSLGK